MVFKNMIPNIYRQEGSVINAYYARLWGTVKVVDSISFYQYKQFLNLLIIFSKLNNFVLFYLAVKKHFTPFHRQISKKKKLVDT